MRVLLRLGDVELPRAGVREHLGERVPHLLLPERERDVQLVGVAGHRREVDAALDERLRELARAVGAEVEEDRGVSLGRGAARPRRTIGSRNSSVTPAL